MLGENNMLKKLHNREKSNLEKSKNLPFNIGCNKNNSK